MTITDKFIQNFYTFISKKQQSDYNFELNSAHRRVEKLLKHSLSENALVDFRNNNLADLQGAINFPDKHAGKFISRGMIKHYLATLLYLIKNKRRVKKQCKVLDQVFFDLQENKIGKPITYRLFNFNETGTNIYNNFYYSIIQKFLKNIEYTKILEIGGGFGKLCSIFKLNNRNLQYNIIELPGESLIAYYYLEKLFSNNFVTNFVYKANDIETLSEDINIFSSTVISKDLKIFKDTDIVINTQSFQHMNKQNINFYLDLFNENKIKYIISINRHQPQFPDEVNFVNYFNNQGYKMTDSYKLDLIYSGLYLSLFKKDV